MQVKDNLLFGLNFYDKNLVRLSGDIKSGILNGEKRSIYTPNVDHIINVKCNCEIFEKYKVADYIIADGWPVAAAGSLKKKSIHKITGVDVMEELLTIADENNLNIYFLGATDDTLLKLEKNIRKDFQNIGSIKTCNGYFKESDNENIIRDINQNSTNILFVGMGSPKQELWISENLSKLNINIAIAIGGGLKIYSGEIERAPRWIQKIGMEWFFRFLKEPTRLFSRYFIKYPKFIKYLITEVF
ncbi:MAG: WecB/TagA/CpsF family glycosyltransferase [Sarcina sp.]